MKRYDMNQALTRGDDEGEFDGSFFIWIFGILGFLSPHSRRFGKDRISKQRFCLVRGKIGFCFLECSKSAYIYMCVHSFRACTLMESCMLVGNRHGLLVVVGSYHVR